MRMLSLASQKLRDFVSLYLGPLQKSLRSLLFLIILRSPVTMWPWFLPMNGELEQLHGKKIKFRYNWSMLISEVVFFNLKMIDRSGLVRV